MSGEDEVSESVSSLRAGLAMSRMQLPELWAAYVGLGGSLSMEELAAGLRGTRVLSAHDHDVVAQALNDHFIERGQDHPVPYSEDLAGRPSAARPREH